MFSLYLNDPIIMTININLNQLLCWFVVICSLLIHLVFPESITHHRSGAKAAKWAEIRKDTHCNAL